SHGQEYPSAGAPARTARPGARTPSRQGALEDLPGRIAGQPLQEDHVAGDLVPGEVRRDVALHLVRGESPSGGAVPAEDDVGPQPLPELLVRNADDGGLLDGGMGGEEVLDLAGVDVLPAGHDHVVGAAVDVQPAALVEVAEVADRHQPADLLLAAPAGVAAEPGRGVDEDAAGRAGRHGPAVVAEDRDRGPGGRAADAAR